MFFFCWGGYCIMDDQLYLMLERLLLCQIMFEMHWVVATSVT